jgi:NhaA family Na+:H+ antiporter
MRDRHDKSPLHEAEHDFRPWVLFGIMPIFAFANAGVDLAGAEKYLTHPVTLGAGLGLVFGKPIGIALCAFIAAKLMRARLPGTLTQMVGVACLAGIGFTMSLFIGALAFKDPSLATPTRLGVYAGSVFSALLGLLTLAQALPPADKASDAAEDDETAPFIKPEPVFEARDRVD